MKEENIEKTTLIEEETASTETAKSMSTEIEKSMSTETMETMEKMENSKSNDKGKTKDMMLLNLLQKMELATTTTGTAITTTNDENIKKENYSMIGKYPSKEHRFWNTQPVIQRRIEKEEYENNNKTINIGPIEPSKTSEEIRQIPYTLPPGYEWCNMNLLNDQESHEIYNLLTQNYVEDDDNMFRFDYSIEFLKWALLPPGFISTLHIGVRNKGKLVAFISGIPVKIRVHDTIKKMVEINFLCVHKRLRSKRLAPVLIKEITRRTNIQNIFQAVYTAGIVLPTPIGDCRYYHRSINPKKLIEVKFSYLPQHMTLARIIKMYKLPDSTILNGLRPMARRDISHVCKLFRKYMDKFSLVPILNEQEVEHWLLPRENVIYSYVIANENNEVTDFCSFYHLPSSIIGNEKYKTLHAAYSYYNIATTVALVDLMNDALILAKKNNFDVFNALNCMENNTFLQKLKFGVGDGTLQYYLYNWKCPRMNPDEIGLILC